MADKSRLDDLKTYIQAQGWRWTPGKPLQHGEQIVVMDGQSQSSIAFYFKHQSLVPGGVNSPLKTALTAWINGEAPPVTPTAAPTVSTGTRLDMLKQFIRERGWNWGPGAINHGEQIVVSNASVTALVNFWPKKGALQVQGQDSSLKATLEAWVNGDSATLPVATPASIAPSPSSIDELDQGEVERIVRRPTSSVQGAAGSPVKIETETWRVQYHSTGFWRYTFQDGGLLDWWDGSAKGTIYVHGKADAESVRILKSKTASKTWLGEREKMDQAVEKYIPRYGQSEISSVIGIGWHRCTTVLGARFDFSDGAVLNYYTGKEDKGKFLIQGKPSPLTEAALKALPNPFWAGLDALTATLKQLFPDWKLGEPTEPGTMEEGLMSETTAWTPLDNALDWQRMQSKDRTLREAIHEGAPCQKALIDDWASVLSRHQERRHLLAHAPTGLGKTLAALIPALAWVAEDPDQRRAYYLVNRLAQHDNPLRELKAGLAILFEQHTGQPLRVVDLVGRGLLCHYPQARSLSDTCRAARDNASFDILPDGVCSWQEIKNHLGRRVCPYHTLQGLMAQAHVIICDYWWLFSPTAHSSGDLFPSPIERAGFSPTDSIVIVDEAHNLVPRVRSWLDVDALFTDVERTAQRAAPNIQQCLTPVLDVLKSAPPEKALLPSALLARAGGVEVVQVALDELREMADPDEAVSVPERLLRLLLRSDEAVVIYTEADWQTQARRVLGRLVDPAPLLQAGYGRVFTSLSMSGTLSAPADSDAELRYQVPLLGLPIEATLVRKYASPFPLRNQRWIYNTDTLGTSKARVQFITRYAEHIVNVSRTTPGVTAVFFSSYAFLEQVRDAIDDPTTRALTVCETRADAALPDTPVNLAAYEQRLRELVSRHGRAILLAIYSGKLSEGANFEGNLIKSVICVSIPMEYPKLFHERLQTVYTRYFAEIAESLGDDPAVKAREYALDRLSLSLVLQACGRGIRREEDRCAFVLLDRRYHQYDWRRFLMPRPYNLQNPGQATASFQRNMTEDISTMWDKQLLRSDKKTQRS